MSELAVKEVDLIEDIETRKEHLEKVEVLDKIKKLTLLPNTELMTTRAVAEWFEVTQEVIRDNLRRNESELRESGVVFKKHREIKDLVNRENISQLKIPTSGTNVFTKRAVLNLGMLLRDSLIAKELRNHILNVYESAPDEIKDYSIEYEKQLSIDVLFAKSEEDKLKAMKKYKDYKDKYINKLEDIVNEQEPKVKVHDQLVASVNVTDMIIIAKNIGVGEKKLFEFLRATKVLFKQGQDNVPRQPYQNNKCFKVKANVRYDKYGREFRYYTIKVTGKGKIFINELINSYGGAEVINKLKLGEIKEYVDNYKLV